MCEGLSERVLPGVFHLARGADAAGRLEQPLTYWNAMGLLAAVGTVLLARIGGDRSRPRPMRVAAFAAAPITTLAIYLTLSRGAFLAVGVGLTVLLLLDASWTQARAILQVLVSAAPPILVGVARFDLRTFGGALSTRERDGLILLAVLVLSGLASAAVAGRALPLPAVGARRFEIDEPPRPTPHIRRFARLAGVGVALATMLIVLITATSTISASNQPTASNARLVTTETIRGNFWRVAIRGFLDHPLVGTGAGGFETEWNLRRPIIYFARDAHSLYLETLCELGLVGGLLLLWLFVAAGASMRQVRRLDPVLSAGWIAVLTMWAVHAGFDWDWEMPGVTLLAAVLLGAVVARASADVEPTVDSTESADASTRSAPVGVPG